jgi:iron complex outermembrane receptor protein
LGRRLCLPLSLLTVLAAGQGGAQEPSEEDLLLSFGDEEFVSIATGRRQLISKAPAVATVITARDIEQLGAANLDEVLEAVPGLHVSTSSGRLSPKYIIRGISSDFNPEVLVLINGVPMTQVWQGDRGVRSSLPVRSIQRVEVIRGPGSAVYGADAFSGVINVITKTAEDIDGVQVGGRVGSFSTREAWALAGGSLQGFDVSLTLEASTTDGDDDREIGSDAQTLFDGLFSTNASLAPGSLDTRMDRLDARLQIDRGGWTARGWYWGQRDTGNGPGLAQALDASADTETDNLLLDLTYEKEQISTYWDLTGRISYMGIDSDSENDLYPPGAVLPIGSDGNVSLDPSSNLVLFTDGLKANPGINEDHYRADINAFFSRFRHHRIRLAAGFHYVELTARESKNFGPGVIIDNTVTPVDGSLTSVTGTPFIFVPDEDRKTYYASIQDEWNMARDWNLTAGLRYDHYSDFGNTVNPRLALVWNTTNDLTSKLLYGRAFRAPSFLELYAVNNPVVLGNSDLDAETIDMLELAFDYRPASDLRTALNLFGYKIEDRIEFVADPTGASRTADNAGEQTGYGLEIEADWSPLPSLDLRANYAFQNSEDDRTNNDVPDAPRHQAYGDARWRFLPDWLATTQINWVGERPRAEADPRSDLSAYTWIDVLLQWRDARDRFGVTAGIRNLTDKTAREPSPFAPGVPGGAFIPEDYPLEGRSYFLQGEVGF